MPKFPSFLTSMQIARNSHRLSARSTVGARAMKAACLLMLASLPLPAADGPVGITDSCCWATTTARCGNREQIADGTALVEGALGSRRFGPYTLQAAEARKSYRRALELTHQASERRFLENRLAELEK
jgi:hypothetical protein